jgi:hypothetical protein
MEAHGTAVLTNEIPTNHAISTTVSRVEVADALHNEEPELFLDLDRGDEHATIGITWSHDELEKLLERASGGEDIVFTFDRDELTSMFDEVEAHGLREKALVFTVAVAGALGSSAAIANAAIPMEQGSGAAASAAAVHALAVESSAGITSAVHTPGVQLGDEAAAASASSLKVAKTDAAAPSSIHTPGVQLGDGTASASASSLKVAKTDAGAPSNIHTPGVQLGAGESTVSTPAVKVSGSGSDSEFLGVNTQDVTDALIAGGVLLAIAGATFAGTRRPGSARPA